MTAEIKIKVQGIWQQHLSYAQDVKFTKIYYRVHMKYIKYAKSNHQKKINQPPFQ